MIKSRKMELIAYIVIGAIAISIILPFLLLFMSSFTDEMSITRNGYSFFTKDFSLGAYEYLWKGASTISRAYMVSIVVTIMGTVMGLIMTVLCAYPLSRRDLPGRNILTFYVFFTMLFNGGLVPTYLIYTQYFHVKNTIGHY